MTYESKLQAVLEAQVAGRYICWGEKFLDENFNPPFTLFHGDVQSPIHDEDKEYYDSNSVLEILLDTTGCRVAYGEEPSKEKSSFKSQWRWAAERILDAWNSGEGNNWQAAIDMAYDLLPNC